MVFNGTAGNDSLTGTDGDDTLNGLAGSDTLAGRDGNDVLDGGSGTDTMNGGAGDDYYIVTGGDVLVDVAGSDTVQTAATWHLAAGFENLVATGTATTSHGGNALDNFISGNDGANWISGRQGNDTLMGNAGNDTFNMSNSSGDSYGMDNIDGGDGVDTLDYGAAARTAVVVDLLAGAASGGGTGGAGSAVLASVENVNGSGFDDRIGGNAAANFLYGYNGNDTLDGGTGNDRLEGAAGSDQYAFSAVPGAGNADVIVGFASGADSIAFDRGTHADLGPAGAFGAGDERFAAGAGFTSGQDGDDRVIYDTTTGRLFYDADGSGAGAAQLVATLQGAPALTAGDLHAVGEPSGTASPTQGNDSLVGTEGDDTIDGLGGDDTIAGLGGNDSLIGGAGSDRLTGGAGNDTLETSIGDADFEDFDTLDGGMGDDTYILDRNVGDWSPTVSLSDAGGIDTVIARSGHWVLGPGFENLTLDFDFSSDGSTRGIGNELGNVIIGFHGWWAPSHIDGADGNDTLIGGDGGDRFSFEFGSGDIGEDEIDGAAGDDWLDYSGARSAVTVDFRDGTATGGGNGGSGSAAFINVENATGTQFDDLLVGNDGIEHETRSFSWFGGPVLVGSGGDDTLLGGAATDELYGDEPPGSGATPSGDDHLEGRGGGDRLVGGAGTDWLHGGVDNDTLNGGAGADSFAFREAPRADHADLIEDFAPGSDKVLLDRAVHADLGEAGDFAADDARFLAAPGALSGQAPSHRVIYDTATGTLYYDADGDGAGAAHPIATLQGAPALSATDISAFGEPGSPPPPPEPIVGTPGDDTLVGTEGDDVIQGLAGDDLLEGLGGNDKLEGGEGDDTLDAGAGIDTLDGGAGNDTYIVAPGDVITDAGGIDHVRSSTSWTLDDGLENLTIEATGSFVEGIGNALDNELRLVGGGGSLRGREGNDRLQAEGGSIQSGDEGNDTLIGGVGFDNLFGDAGDDLLDDRLDDESAPFSEGGANFGGGSGNDTILGGAADDLVQLGGDYGQDSVDGGSGRDAITFEEALSGVVVRLAAGTAMGGGTAGSGAAALANVEDVYGTELDDHIIGDSGANRLVGRSFFYHAPSDGPDDGNDTLDGLAGNDTLEGGSNADQFVFSVAPGAPNADSIVGFAPGADKVALDAAAHSNIGAAGNFAPGDARFFAAAGATSGQDASDRVVYDTSTGNLWYDADGSGSGAAQLVATLEGAPSLQATDIEVAGEAEPAPNPGVHLTGTSGSDTLVGTEGDDTLEGLGGSDRLDGRGGDDWFEGGTGQDWFIGGAGADSFAFRDAPTNANLETLTDFTSGTDKLRFDPEAFGAIGALGDFAPNDDRFHAAPGARSGVDAEDRLIYNTSTGVLYYDPDGSGSNGQSFVAVLRGAPLLVATDISVIGGDPGPQPIVGTEGDDSLVGTDGDDTIRGLGGDDTLVGAEGADSLSGGGGNDVLDAWVLGNHGDLAVDTLEGGLGDDTYRVSNDGDVILADPGGLDTVRARNTDWTLGAGLDNLILDDTVGSAFVGIGNELDNFISGSSEGGSLFGMEGNDVLVLANAFNFSDAHGGEGNDTLAAARDSELFGDAGDDVLVAYGIGSTMTGGLGADTFVFDSAGGTSSIEDFASGVDKIRLDASSMQQLGASGNFAAGDPRFFAGAAADSGQDASDRVVYNTTTGQFWFDADGSGAGEAHLIATLQGAPALVATDIEVVNGAPGGSFIVGTEGNDSLTGTASDDTIDGLGGNDTINGAGGNDLLIGGAGNDALSGGEQHTPEDSHDTLDGGAGDDVYDIFTLNGTSENVVLIDSGGIDTVIAASWVLAEGFENLVLRSPMGGSGDGRGNALDNLISVESVSFNLYQVWGGDGDDTLVGGGGVDLLDGEAGDDWLDGGIDGPGQNELTGGAGSDSFVFREPPEESGFADFVIDFTSNVDVIVVDNHGFTAVGGAGSFTAGDARFAANASGTAADASDRIVYNTATGELHYDPDGNGAGDAVVFARLEGAPPLAATDIQVIGEASNPGVHLTGSSAADTLTGGAGDDTLEGLGGSDRLFGNDGDDWHEGGTGQEWHTGGGGADSFVFREPLANANLDTITDFTPGTDRLVLDDAVLADIGAPGDFAEGDDRFHAAPGARSGVDAEDRFIYNTDTGVLYYDPDGSGSDGQSFVAVLRGAPELDASDITII